MSKRLKHGIWSTEQSRSFVFKTSEAGASDERFFISCTLRAAGGRITGPLYLFKYGIPSAAGGTPSEEDANRRSAYNQLPLSNQRLQGTNRLKWWEVLTSPVTWPFIWSWNR